MIETNKKTSLYEEAQLRKKHDLAKLQKLEKRCKELDSRIDFSFTVSSTLVYADVSTNDRKTPWSNLEVSVGFEDQSHDDQFKTEGMEDLGFIGFESRHTQLPGTKASDNEFKIGNTITQAAIYILKWFQRETERIPK